MHVGERSCDFILTGRNGVCDLIVNFATIMFIVLLQLLWVYVCVDFVKCGCVYMLVLLCVGVLVICVLVYCRDRVSSCNMYAVQQDIQSVF